MDDGTRAALEEYDLQNLFRALNGADGTAPPPALPALPDREDLWSRLIDGAQRGDGAQLRALAVEVNRSKLGEASKLWWNTVLAMGLDAPDEVVQQLGEGTCAMSEEPSEDDLAAAARLLARELLRSREIREEQRSQSEAETEEQLSREVRLRRSEKEKAAQELDEYRDRQNADRGRNSYRNRRK